MIIDGMLVGAGRPLAPYLALAAMWLAGMGAVFWLAAPGLRRLTNFLGSPWTWLDRELGSGLRLGELLAGTLAALFVLLPGGGPSSVWTLLRIVLVLGALLLALARPLQVVVIAVATIPFIGVVARTGVFDRPVAEMLILVLATAWVVRALWTRAPQLPRGLWLWLPLYFGLAALAAAVFADFQKFALRDLRTVILEPLLLFMVIAAAARSRRDVQRVLAALGAGGRTHGRRGADSDPRGCGGHGYGRAPAARVIRIAQQLGDGAGTRAAAGFGPGTRRMAGAAVNAVSGGSRSAWSRRDWC